MFLKIFIFLRKKPFQNSVTNFALLINLQLIHLLCYHIIDLLRYLVYVELHHCNIRYLAQWNKTAVSQNNKKLSLRSGELEDAATCKKITFESLTRITGTVAKGWSAKRFFIVRSSVRSSPIQVGTRNSPREVTQTVSLGKLRGAEHEERRRIRRNGKKICWYIL